MTTLEQSIRLPVEGHLRPLEPRTDLFQVADLIELCFARTMDADGREYLRHMRGAAQEAAALRWAPVSPETTRSISGYVWVEEGRITGNLSLIPLTRFGRRVNLIANVAVHPDQRRKGIGRALTQAALDFSAAAGAWASWLQVRADNPGAYTLYRQLGFVERARRVTWMAGPGPHPRQDVRLAAGVAVTARFPTDWELQRAWLAQMYPASVIWNLPLNPGSYSPGLMSSVMRFIYNTPVRHWAARRGDDLIGMLTWEPSRTYADNLWLAVNEVFPENEEPAIRALLPYALQHNPGVRPLSLNYAAGRMEGIIAGCGFERQQELIWMEVRHKD